MTDLVTGIVNSVTKTFKRFYFEETLKSEIGLNRFTYYYLNTKLYKSSSSRRPESRKVLKNIKL